MKKYFIQQLQLQWQQLLDAYDEQYGHFYFALPTYNQMALAKFIDDGLLEKHIRKGKNM